MEIRNQEIKFRKKIENILQENIHLLPKRHFKVNLSTDHEDTKLSFDMVLESNIQISVRLRESKYESYTEIDNTKTSLTIRYRSNSGYETEIDKLERGLGQIYFYGIMNEDETDLLRWHLIDIEPLRDKIKILGKVHCNKFDNTMLKSYSHGCLKLFNAIICEYFKNK